MQKAAIILRDSVRQTDKLFTYLIPERLDERIVPGSYVEVPFGRGNMSKTGVVYEVSDATSDDAKLKTITRLLDPLPVLTPEQICLIKPLATRYLCTMGDVVSLMVPSIVGRKAPPKETYCYIKNHDEVINALANNSFRSMAHVHMLEYLLSEGPTIKKQLLNNTDSTENQLKTLRDKGYVGVEIKEVDPATKNASEVALLDEPTDDVFKTKHSMNDEQLNAYNKITASSDNATIHLLHGITGSGKTEVYLNCAGKILSEGGSVLYMVPEISLTPQTVNWIIGRFGKLAAVMHSRLTDKQRYEQWDLIRQGIARIIVAPRSGVFAPIANLKLIIIDEEHDTSYKSETFPKYNTKDIAILRARYNKCAVVLGSATPSVTSYYAAKRGVYNLIKLSKRANPNAVLPKVKQIDMKAQIKEGAGEILSLPLRSAMAKAFSENKQVLIFLNRRGFARTLVCSSCGSSCSCPNCSVGMTLHSNRRSNSRMLICHYCGYTIPESEAKCDECSGTKFTKAGIGTQQLEDLLGKLFPAEKVLRMDQDTTLTPGSHESILAKFRNHEASILIGTQMIAKGHDFPDVTVVGVLGADLMLNSSDYRASERAFQLITQSAGRAGRAGFEGEVYIQSYKPENPILKFASVQNYEAFYESEIKYREDMRLPPFKATGDIVLSLPDEDLLMSRISSLSNYLKDFLANQPLEYAFELYGPIEAPIYELRGRYRMMFVIKAVNKSALNAVFKQVMKDFNSELYPLSFDNDSAG